MRLEAAERIGARRGEPEQTGEVRQHAGDRVPGQRAQAVVAAASASLFVVWSVSQMLQWRCAPLPAWSAKGLGASDATRPCCAGDAADGLPVGDLVVGRRERRGMPDRQLLLAPAELGVRQLDGQALFGQRGDDVLDDLLGRFHPDGAEAQALVDRPVAVLGPEREVELVLEGGVEGQTRLRRLRDHALEERARVERPGRMVELDHVDEHLAAARGIRQDHEGVRIRDQPDLADRSVGRIRGERVEARERLHPLDQADAALHPARQLADVRALAADHAAVVAVQEADELEAALLGLGDDLVRCHLGVPR